jgi:hypothetical protein
MRILDYLGKQLSRIVKFRVDAGNFKEGDRKAMKGIYIGFDMFWMIREVMIISPDDRVSQLYTRGPSYQLA